MIEHSERFSHTYSSWLNQSTHALAHVGNDCFTITQSLNVPKSMKKPLNLFQNFAQMCSGASIF